MSCRFSADYASNKYDEIKHVTSSFTAQHLNTSITFKHYVQIPDDIAAIWWDNYYQPYLNHTLHYTRQAPIRDNLDRN